MQPRYTTFRLIQALLPKRLQQRLASARWTQGLRDSLFRAGVKPRIATGDVAFEGLTFTWAAPLQVLARAQKRGVENRICRVISQNVSDGNTCIDVGANYGFLSMIMSRTVGEKGRVVSIEADEHIFQVAKSTFERNNANNIDLRLARAGRLHDQEAGSVSVDGLAEQVAVEIDLIKIDVDGPDFDVLQGSQNVLETDRPLVVIEMTDHQAEIYRFLRNCGYDHLVGMSGETISASGPWPANLFAWSQIVRGLPSKPKNADSQRLR